MKQFYSLGHHGSSVVAHGSSLVAQLVKSLLAMQETWVCFLVWEDPLEKWQPTPVFLPAESHRGACQAPERLTTYTSKEVWENQVGFHMVSDLENIVIV